MSELLNKSSNFFGTKVCLQRLEAERNQNSSFWQSAKAIPVSWNQTIMQD